VIAERRRLFALLAMLSIGVLSFDFGARHLITNDDTRFPVLARDVLDNGHWLLPTLPDGLPHLAKPPLMAWLIALASWPGGVVTVRTAVLPSLLAAIGVALLTWWLGARLFNPSAGGVAMLVVVTMLGVHAHAHSAMPDMVQLCVLTAAMAVFAASDWGRRPRRVTAFYGLIGLASLSKGAAGLLPLAIAIVFTIANDGARAAKRLVSMPGWIIFVLIAVPWWVTAAMGGGGKRFVDAVVVRDQLAWYFGSRGWGWQAMAARFSHPLAVMLPWCVALPMAIRAARRPVDSAQTAPLRFLFVWLATVFAIIAISNQQRERYYLPLCPAAALLVGWWYSTLPERRRAWVFATVWGTVVLVGGLALTLDTPRYNATTDLAQLGHVVGDAPAPIYAMDVPELVLSFNLDRRIPAMKFSAFETRVGHGDRAYLVISDRALAGVATDPCLEPVARGLATRRAFTVLRPRPACAEIDTGGRHQAAVAPECAGSPASSSTLPMRAARLPGSGCRACGAGDRTPGMTGRLPVLVASICSEPNKP